MSLINDALRRAQATQQQPPPLPTGPVPLRPVEPTPYARHGLGLMVPVVLAVLALLALFIVWQYAQGGRKSTELHEARALAQPTPQVLAPSPTALPPAAPIARAAETSAAPPQESPPSSSAASVADAPAVATPDKPAQPPVTEEQPGAAPTPAVTAPPPPKPPPLRLQAIVFHPQRPSALINGKTLFVGDRLGAARVVAIDRESATLVDAGKTLVLALPE